ncbi:MAG: GxxExxY protein [Deltaproteobacteria bacterium]|nr:GxxExxY protein [Deltaproteobacteria bacterium]
MLEFGELTERIIGAAIAVHRSLGPGFLESIYEASLALEFGEQGVTFERQVMVPVRYRGVAVGEHRLDLLVEKTIVVELKAVKQLEDVHFAVVRSYLHALSLQHGLLINFNAVTLQVKRVLASAANRNDE